MGQLSWMAAGPHAAARSMKRTDEPEVDRVGTPVAALPIGDVRTGWASDARGEPQGPPVLELADGSSCSYLAALPRGGSDRVVRQRLSHNLAQDPSGAVDSAQALRLSLLRTMREVEPRPHSLAAAVTRGRNALVAVTHGATATLVRGGRIVERSSDAGVFGVQPGDRIVLACSGLDPLVQDADELARVVSADDPQASATTLVEIGHLRGGVELAAVIAEVGATDEPTDDTSSEGSLHVSLGDLLAGLGPALDQHRGTPTPMPRTRRVPRAHPPAPRRPVEPAPPPRPALIVRPAPPPPAIEPEVDEDEETEEGPPPPSGSLSAGSPPTTLPPSSTPGPDPVPYALAGFAVVTAGTVAMAAGTFVLWWFGAT